MTKVDNLRGTGRTRKALIEALQHSKNILYVVGSSYELAHCLRMCAHIDGTLQISRPRLVVSNGVKVIKLSLVQSDAMNHQGFNGIVMFDHAARPESNAPLSVWRDWDRWQEVSERLRLRNGEI